MSVIRPPMTLQQQAEFLDYIADRCTVRSGSHAGDVAGETLLSMSNVDVADLKYIADRLHHMAPHAAQIRRVVIGQ